MSTDYILSERAVSEILGWLAYALDPKVGYRSDQVELLESVLSETRIAIVQALREIKRSHPNDYTIHSKIGNLINQ